MAIESTPDRTSAPARAATSRVSSRRSTAPSARRRSRTSSRRLRGTSGSGFAVFKSYSSNLRSRPISSVSRKPSVVMSPVTAPRRSISALVNSVVACTTRVNSRAGSPCRRNSPSTPAATARAGSSCVVRTLRLYWRPPA